MSDLDDDLADIDYQGNFDEDRVDVEALLAKLGRIQRAIARREHGFLAAVEAYNAAVQAAYEQFSRTGGEYLRFKDTTYSVCSAIEFELRLKGEEKEEESADWDQSEEGLRHQKWLDIWVGFCGKVWKIDVGRPERVKAPETPLSAMIAALPRLPDDLKPSEVPRAEADRLIDPKIAASVAASWKRIDAWLTRNAPHIMEKMGKAATPKAISAAERSLGVELPDAVRASYLIHDGSGEQSIFPSGDYLSLDEMLGQYKVWKELVEEGTWDDEESEPNGPIQKVHYHLKWIPLTHNGGGDHTLIDLAPAEGGVIGQLIDFSHEMGPEGTAATGLSEYLSYLADGLEAGGGVVERTYIEWTRGEEWKRSGYAPIPPQSAPKARAATRYFEFTAGTSNKFWEVAHEGTEMTTRYGKIGTNGQATTKSFESQEKAASETDKIIAKKLKEGYVEKVL